MNSRVVMFVCAMLLVSPLFVVSGPAAGTAGSSGGNGRAVTLIHNATELQNMASSLTASYWLANDIDASETANWNGGAGFNPVGTIATPFSGTFDGKGFRITGLVINRPTSNNIGLFSYIVTPALIERVDLECNFKGRQVAGGVCAYANGGTIANCTVRGSVSTINYGAGGICGVTGTVITINDCTNYANVAAGTNLAGGIVGGSYAVTKSCMNLGNVSAVTGTAGGLVGDQEGGSISNCFAAATVSASTNNGDMVGGFIGFLGDGSIDSCYAASNTTGRNRVGGFAGNVYWNRPISRSFSAGTANGTGDVGGFVGMSQGPITDCYAITTVISSAGCAGFVGACEMGGSCTRCYAAGEVVSPVAWAAGFCGGGMGSASTPNCFWDTQATGRTNNQGPAVGKTTVQMMTGSTFTSATWDFTNTWGIIEGKTYPYLRWRYPSPVIVTGKAFSDGGVTPAANGTPIGVVDGSGLSAGMGNAKANATGWYRQLAQPGPVIAFISGMPYKGASLKPDVMSMDNQVDVQGGRVMATCGPNANVQLKELGAAKRRFGSNELPYNFSKGSLVMDSGISFLTGTGTAAILVGDLSAVGGDISFGGPVRMPENSTLTASNIQFDTTATANETLALNCTSDIMVSGPLQAATLTIFNARHLTSTGTIIAGAFDQQVGTGTTAFGTNGLIATTATVRASAVTGTVNTGALGLATSSASLNGLVGGKGGQQGADTIALLNNILPGTHFFDGIDLYKFTPTSLPDATEDAPYLVNFTPMNPGDAVTWSIESPMAWLTMSANGSLTGTPGNGDVGKSYVNVIVHNGPLSLAYNLTLAVLNANDAPQILTQNVLTATEDQPYSVYYSGSDIDPTADVLSWAMTAGPAWLFMDQNNLHGTPGNGDVGTHAVTVTLSDGKGGIISTSFNITVANVNDAPVITSVPTGTATQGQLYNFTFTASDIDANDSLSWSLTAGADWLSMNSTTGTLSGTPSNGDVGTIMVTVAVKDAAGAGANLSYALRVQNVNDAPSWATVPVDQNMTEGQQLVAAAKATDIDAADSMRYSLTSTPASGITIDPSSGAIFWAAAVPGSYVVSVTATDGAVPITCSFNVTVAKLPVIVNNAPTIDTIAAQTVTSGKMLSVKITGKDADSWDARNLTFSLVGPLTGMVISSDGSFVWTPAKDQVGTNTVTVQLSDGKNSTTATFTVTVKKAAEPAKPAGDSSGAMMTGTILGLIIGVLIGAVVVFAVTRKPRGGAPEPEAPAPASQAPPAAQASQPEAPASYRPSAPERMTAPPSKDDLDDDIDEDFPDAEKPEPVPPMKKAGEGQAPPPAPVPPAVPPPE